MKGKVAIVTGASRGIGKAIALGYAREGATVVVAARSETAPSERLPGSIHETVEQIEALGGRALAVRCDVTDEASVNAMVEQTLAEFGRVDVLVNNAAVDFPSKVVDMPAQALGGRVPGGPHRAVPVLQGGAAGHDRAGRRQHHQHHLARRLRERAPAPWATAPPTPPPRPGSTASPTRWRPRWGSHNIAVNAVMPVRRHRHGGHEHVGHRRAEEDLRGAGRRMVACRRLPGPSRTPRASPAASPATTSTSCGTG